MQFSCLKSQQGWPKCKLGIPGTWLQSNPPNGLLQLHFTGYLHFPSPIFKHAKSVNFVKEKCFFLNQNYIKCIEPIKHCPLLLQLPGHNWAKIPKRWALSVELCNWPRIFWMPWSIPTWTCIVSYNRMLKGGISLCAVNARFYNHGKNICPLSGKNMKA